MDFRLTEEEQAIQAAARELARKEFAPHAAEYDRTHQFPRRNFDLLAQGGYLGMTLPARYGGGEAGYLSYTLCVEAFSQACATTGVIFEVHNSLHSEAVFNHGTEEQRERFLPPLCRGERLGAYALTEPNAGSDAAAIAATASRVDGGWRLNGRKVFITNGGEADEYLVYASSDSSRGSRGITCFIVPKEAPGISFGPPLEKLGIRASATTDVILEDVFVPDDRVLGTVHEGYKIALRTLHSGRIGIAAQAVGILQASLDNAARYTLQRETFGKKIADHQMIQWHLAEMATELEAARLLLYRAAWMHGEGIRATKEISMAKLFASRVAVEGTLRGVQILGGYGYMSEYPQERLMRDAKITEIYEGTSEIQRLVVARALLEGYRGNDS
ncbi:MAG: acyl-CoA dehydrogenase family protein [Thermaerobacter sp.]|nr:acyl-CoA dehydrogenase family protein [Thermaerobacter sp.]